jgi:hypothetical protein
MPPIMTTLLAAVLVAPVAVLTPAAFRIRGLPAFAAAGLTAALGGMVISSIALSPFHGLNAGGLLVAQTFLAAASIGLWIAAGKPPIPRPAFPDRAAVRAQIEAHPVTAAIVGFTLAALLLELILGFLVAPSNWDAMTYHLARAAFWLQQDSLAHFENGTAAQLAYPPNGEILQAWTMAISGDDYLVAAVQWASLVGVLACIVCGVRLLGFGRAPALWAAAIFALLQQPILQASSPQNDMIVAFFLGAATVFLVRGLRDGHRGEIAIGSMALGLAIGTKGTALFMLPSLLLIICVVLVKYRPPRAIIRVSALFVTAGVVVFGSFGYIQNVVDYGDPIGPVTFNKRDEPVATNLLWTTWSFVDTPGAEMHWLDLALSKPLTKVFGQQDPSRFAGFTADPRIGEDWGGFGYVGWLILLPLLAYCLLARPPPGRVRTLAAAAVLYLLVFAVAKKHDEFVARLLMPMVALAAPLLATLYRRKALVGLVSFLAIAGALPVLLTNPGKALLVDDGAARIFDYDHEAQKSFNRPDFAPVIPNLNRLIAADAPLGIVVLSGNDWVYPFFGHGLERRVVELKPDQAGPRELQDRGLAGVVWPQAAPPPGRPVELAPGYWFVAAAN